MRDTRIGVKEKGHHIQVSRNSILLHLNILEKTAVQPLEPHRNIERAQAPAKSQEPIEDRPPLRRSCKAFTQFERGAWKRREVASTIARDISARRHAERDLTASEVRYRRLFETTNDGILMLDAETGHILDVNPSMIDMLGFSYDEFLGKKLWDVGPFKDIGASKAAFHDLQNKEYIRYENLPLQTSDGRRIDVEFVSNLYSVGDKKLIQCNIRDITQRKQAEHALQVLKENLEQRVADRTRESREKNATMRAELEIAHELQLAMLPQHFPTVPPSAPSSESALRFFSILTPSGVVSGDFFDVLSLSDAAVGVFICDVMGHGVSAALVAAMMRALIEERGPQVHDPGQLLTQINRVLARIFRKSRIDVFATAFYLVADVARSQLFYANAGHPSPLHMCPHKGEVAPMLSDGSLGPALGLFEDAAYQSCRRPMAAGDLVIMFTDGLFEVGGPEDEHYGQERLLAAVRKRFGVPLPKLVFELLAETRQFSLRREFEDDVCLVGMEITRCG
jgi:PAS domain S-box-containing protein